MKRNRPRLTPVLLLASCILAAFPGTAAVDSAPESVSPTGAIDKDLARIRVEIQNMKAKARAGVVGYGRKDAEGQMVVSGWIGLCCTRNIRSLNDRVEALYRTTELLIDLYSRAGDLEGVAAATELQEDVKVMRQKLQELATAPDQAGAQTGLVHFSRAFQNVDQDRKKIEGCCNALRVPAVR